MQHSTVDKGVLGEPTGLLNQGTDGRTVVQVVHSSVEDGTRDGDGILVTAVNGIDDDRVSILQTEIRHIKLRDIVAREMLATDTTETNALFIGFRSITTCILQQGGHTLVLLHLIGHRALHVADDIHDAVVGSYDDDITIGQTDITRETAIEDIVVDIDDRQLTTTTIDLDVTERSQAVDTTGHVKGMEHGGKG